jgi:hypothetical protein
MRINNLIDSFEIYTTNEEQEVLQRIDNRTDYQSYTERDQVVIENLVRKSLVSKVNLNDQCWVIKNDKI